MVYKWYILQIGGLYATYHLLGEPETTIDSLWDVDFRLVDPFWCLIVEMLIQLERTKEVRHKTS